MGSPGDNEQVAIAGYHAVHLVAHSYLGSLSIALDQRKGAPGKPVLLRRLQLSEQLPSEALQRMACAGRDAMALSHENVLPVLAVVLQDEALGLAYEYVEAEPLRSLQSWAAHRALAIPVEVSLRIVLDLLRGVRALHGTLLGWPSAPPFGGLSPDSVLVSRDGRTRLCDPLVASCATLLEGMNLNASKLAYTAPEQAYATAPLAAPSDVFSCAVMLWELLAGCRLFIGARAAVERKLLEHDVPSLRAQLPPERQLSERLVLLVERSLAADAARRPQSPGELANELEQCGHEPASHAQVATFVGDLAGVRFDQRRMTVRSLPALRLSLGATQLGPGTSGGNRRVPLPADVSGSSATFRSPISSLELSAATRLMPSGASRGRPLVALPDHPSGARWAVPKLPVFAGLAPVRSEVPVSEALAPSPAAERSAVGPEEPRVAAPAGTGVEGLAAAEPVPARVEPALPAADSVPAAVESAPADGVPRVRPVGSTTMVGLAMPPLLAADRPFESVRPSEPSSSQAVVVIPPDPLAARPSTPTSSAPPLPIPSLVPTLRPSAHGLGAAFADSQRELLQRSADAELARPSGWSQAPSHGRQPRGRVAWASMLGTFALSGALASAFWLGASTHEAKPTLAAAPLPPHATDRSPASATSPRAPAAAQPAVAQPAAVPPPEANAAAAPAPKVAPAPEPLLVSAQLGDEQLLSLFALERRVQLPSCSERLGASARQHTGASPDRSQAALKAARRELMRGNNAEAQQLLCSATLHFPDNVAAWQALADLALHLGDGVRAQEAIEQALKRRPADATLLATLGDIEAARGNLAQSRALWSQDVRGAASDPEREQRLAQQFASLGERKLRDWSYGAALVQFRRAVVLSRGAQAPSAGMAEALRLLGQPTAALAWADRAAAPDDR